MASTLEPPASPAQAASARTDPDPLGPFVVVIPAYDDQAALDATLGSYFAHAAAGPPPAALVVVDNGSPAPLVVDARFADRGVPVALLREPKRGPAAARNTGWRFGAERHASRWTLFVDCGCLFTGSTISGYVGQLRGADADAVAYQGGVSAEGTDWLSAYYQARRALTPPVDALGRPEHLVTASTLVRTRALERVGGFDEAFPWAACEDVDLGLRLRRDVGPLAFAPHSIVKHRWLDHGGREVLGSDLKALVSRYARYGRGRAVMGARHADATRVHRPDRGGLRALERVRDLPDATPVAPRPCAELDALATTAYREAYWAEVAARRPKPGVSGVSGAPRAPAATASDLLPPPRGEAPPYPPGVVLHPTVGAYALYDEPIYASMRDDVRRNDHYRAAIAATVRDRVVVDVGAGKDVLLSAMCVEAGARRVYAIERDAAACRHAAAVIAQRGLADRVVLVPGEARAVTLPEPADVCVSELLGVIGGCEGASAILDDARRLLGPEGVMLPRRCITWIAAVELPDVVRRHPAFTAVGWSYAERIFRAVGHAFDLRVCLEGLDRSALLTTPGVFEDLDFTRPAPPPRARALDLAVTRPGRCDGFLAWIEVRATEGRALDVLGDARSNWKCVFLPAFDSPERLTPGDRVVGSCRGTLSDDGVHPDYEVRGRLLRGGVATPFALTSTHHGRALRETEFHRRLLAPEGGLVLDPRPRPNGAARLGARLRAGVRAHLPEPVVALWRLGRAALAGYRGQAAASASAGASHQVASDEPEVHAS